MSSIEESVVVAEANNVLRKLDMADDETRNVSWKRTGRIQILGGELILPLRLRGGPGDWGPLVASSVIYQRFRERRQASITTGGFSSPLIKEAILPIVVGEFLLFFALIETLRIHGALFAVLWLTSLVGFIVYALFIMQRAFIHKPRGFQFAADKEAAELVGRETMPNVLTKLRGLGLSDVQAGIAERLSILPSVNRRISNLTGPASQEGSEA